MTSVEAIKTSGVNIINNLKFISMKKYLFGALALPLLFACSSDDLLEEKVVSNDQFAGIEKVDATFSFAEEEGPRTRMATDWGAQLNDRYGLAWLGDGTVIVPSDNGKAYQNHPLFVKLNDANKAYFKPETSIYVGKYYFYYPYDESVVDIAEINFKSLENQTITDGMGGENWAAVAKNAINIGDKWIDVTKTGTNIDLDGKMWNKAGIKNDFKIWAASFSNQTGLDLKYVKNNEKFDGKSIAGATDIAYTYPTDSKIGAADIYKIEVQHPGAAKSFTYAPKSEPNTGTHKTEFWADKSALGTGQGFTFTPGAITLNAPDANGISTEKDDNKGWFWFNSLPSQTGAENATSVVNAIFETSYGVVTINETLGDVAFAYEKFNSTDADGTEDWLKIATADDASKSPKEWNPTATGRNSFVNQYGNHVGKYELTVDFSTGVMNGMHIKDDKHLQKSLKYYIASGKTDAGVVLNLDEDNATSNTFKISKISIALLQTINASSTKVLVQPCGTHGTPKIVVTQEGQDKIGLADKKEVPALDRVFAVPTDVYLASDCDWTWAGGTDAKTALTIDNNVKSITNEGTLTVTATNVELTTVTPAATLANAAGATMNITKVTTVKNALTNLGTINVGSSENKAAELRAYDIEIKNDATSLTAKGVINNYGVVGVSETGGTTGKFNNYGLIDMKDKDAITLLTSNELVSDFDDAFDASTNKMGTVNLPENNPTALVSVNNDAENGFIKYTWTGEKYVTPAGIVKYNTIVVSNNITFSAPAPEVQYIEFNGTRTQVVNPTASDKLTNLKGIMVNAGKSIIIEKTNQIVCANGAYLGAGATVYKGGTFTHNANVSGKTASNYFGTWSTDQIVKY